MIELNDVTKTYNKGKENEYEALHNISLKIEAGEMVAIIGTSGAGKSTLLHILGFIDKYDSGSYSIDGALTQKMSGKKMANYRNEKIGMIMQDYALVEDYSVFENVILPLDLSNKKMNRKEKRQRVMDALVLVGMDQLIKKPVKNLSGGQKQRVAIARTIVNSPSFILADEPTGALDSNTSDEILELFLELNQKGKTIVIVTHDPKVAEKCQRIIRIEDGRVIK